LQKSQGWATRKINGNGKGAARNGSNADIAFGIAGIRSRFYEGLFVGRWAVISGHGDVVQPEINA
jgi:hypothetical protein